MCVWGVSTKDQCLRPEKKMENRKERWDSVPDTNLQRVARHKSFYISKELHVEEEVLNLDLFPDKKRGSRLAQVKSVVDGTN